MPFDQHIDQINELIERRPMHDEFTLNDLFENGSPEDVEANQHNNFGIWFRDQVAAGRILRVDDIDIPEGQRHNIHYRRVEQGSRRSWVRMSLPRETWEWIDRQRGQRGRTVFLEELIEAARADRAR
ncbi:hypothetical protein [Alloyangia pacifica]|uniref:hypothetical protein n=1 Tax=Alloyangia pacifica TaxID=311180 RepID=UPI0031D19EAE